LAHYFTVAVKSRSTWLFASDVVLLFVLVLLSFALSARLRVPYSWEALGPALQILAGAIFLGSVASSFASVAFGRVDVRRARKAQWVTLWGTILPAALLFAAYAQWTSTRRLNLATVDDVVPAPAGNWLVIRGKLGERADSSVVFLWNPSKNDFVWPG